MTSLLRNFRHKEPVDHRNERRLIIRLLDHWRQLRGERAYPTRDAFDVGAVEGFSENGFLLEFNKDDIDPVFRYVGGVLATDSGAQLVGKPVSEVPRHTLLTQVTDHYLQVLAHKSPIAFEAEYVNADGDDVLYRSMLLPMSSDGETVDWIVGVINHKLVEPERDRTPAASDPVSAPASRSEPSAAAPLVPPLPNLAMSLTDCRVLAGEAEAADTRSRSALYRALEAAYGFFFECEANREAYVELLAGVGLKVQTRAPFTPIVKLIFGVDYDKTRISEYATALAHARRHNQIAITVKDFIESHPGGIKGCVAAERAARRAERGDDGDSLVQARDALRRLTAIADVPGVAVPDTGGGGDTGSDEFVLLLGRRSSEGNGRVQVLRVLEEKPATVDAAVRRAAKALSGADQTASSTPPSSPARPGVPGADTPPDAAD